MCWFSDGSSKLLEASIESKMKEEKDLHELDIVAHRRLRDVTAAAAVECKQHIKNCEENLQYLKKEVWCEALKLHSASIFYQNNPEAVLSKLMINWFW